MCTLGKSSFIPWYGTLVLILCGPRHQKFSTETSIQAGWEGPREGSECRQGDRESLCHAFPVWVTPSLQWGIQPNSGAAYQERRSLPKCYSSWNKRVRQKELFSYTFDSVHSPIYSSGSDLGFDSKPLSFLGLRVWGKPYLQVGGLGAIPKWLTATPLLWGLWGQ